MPANAAQTPSSDSESALSSPSTSPELRSRLIEIEKEVADLTAQLTRLLRVEKKAVLQRLDAIIYPVLKLPPEITSEIFLHYARAHTRGPLGVASVCKAWRAIAISYPALWTVFYFPGNAPPSDAQATEKLSSYIQCWLPRAGSLPLALIMDSRELLPDVVLAILAQHSSQCMTLMLNLNQPILSPSSNISLPLPALKKLQIKVRHWPTYGPACITAFHHAPQLREADIGSLSLARISLPWIQLTTLALCPFLFTKTTNLENLSLSINSWSSQEMVALPPCTMSHLRSLTFQSRSHHWLLDYLTLPALECLELSQLWAEGRSRVQALVARSGCFVRVLHLIQTDLAQTCHCLSDFPFLTEFTIQFPQWSTGDFTRFFERISSNRDIVPALEVLAIDWCGVGIEVGALTAMLLARRAGVDGTTKLKSFRLSFSFDSQRVEVDQALDELRTLCSDGLELDIKRVRKWATQNINSNMMKYLDSNDMEETL
ncbi:hypothetical protein FB451DRAFT_1252659 [Mycena latifolia]|nr:hypothetical protein FB451DRAFT_1252659 [Mycena latifolia]